MQHCKVSVLIHLVWATRDRLPAVTDDIERAVHHQISAACQDLQCLVLAVGGMPDHVHVLLLLDTTVSLARLAHRLKGSSSHLAGQLLGEDEWPGWQHGYGAFSVSSRDRERVIAYIRRQKQHHADNTPWRSLEPPG